MEKNMDKDIAIKVKNLKYSYADGTEALKGIDVEIEKGSAVAVMGANGSGKSTFFLALNGVMKPSDGSVSIYGKKIQYTKKNLSEVRRKVGIIFQDPDDQLFSADVRQEISFGLFNIGYDEKTCKEKVDWIIEKLNMKTFEKRPTHFLSGGQKKRVAVADILVMEPDITIFDEPAAGLDPRHVDILDEIIDDLKAEGKTVIISTHDPQRALGWADRVIVFHEGKIVGDGTPEEIFSNIQLLEKTSLKQPEVMKLYFSLRNRGILCEEKIPYDFKQLERFIVEAFDKKIR